jgi:hypothetical protein
MKRFAIIIISACAALALAVSCAQTPPSKPEVKPVVKPAPSVTATTNQMDDTSFNNVMSVLKSSLDDEKANPTAGAKLKTAEAYILLIKFIHTDREKVAKSGMSPDDIAFLINDAKDKAQSRLKDVITGDTTPQNVKDEANVKMKELNAL